VPADAATSISQRRAPPAAPPVPASAIAGPRVPGLLQTWLGVIRPLQTRLDWRRRYGRVFRSRDAIAGELFHIADRDLIEQMFKWKPHEYNVAEPRRLMESVLGRSSVLLLDGQRHMRTRKLMLPPFHGEAIAHYADLIEQITNREIDTWKAGQKIRTRSVAQRITMEVIIRAVFGIADPDRIAELMRVLPRLSSPNPFVLLVQKDLGPLSPWGRFVRLRARVDALLYDEIQRRRGEQSTDPRGPILSVLLAARDDDGNALTDEEVRDELITLLLAGHETTATSIGWTVERLLRTPTALERLSAEAAASDGAEYLDAVIKETLRVRPVVTEVFRAPAARTQLGRYVFEADTQLAAAIMLVQSDPDLYPPDPEVFRPERFLEGAPEPYAWIPFGGGVRRCLGAAFAQLEMKVVLSSILARAQLRAATARDEKARFRGITVVPSRGGEAVIERLS
jgi:cytochrome P450